MRSQEVSFETGLPVDGYGKGGFRLAGEVHLGPVAILPEQGAVDWAGWPDLSVFDAQSDAIDIVIIGSGTSLRAEDEAFAAWRAVLEEKGVGVEIMPTPSACRTYNVLLSEGRRIAAALMPV